MAARISVTQVGVCEWLAKCLVRCTVAKAKARAVPGGCIAVVVSNFQTAFVAVASPLAVACSHGGATAVGSTAVAAVLHCANAARRVLAC